MHLLAFKTFRLVPEPNSWFGLNKQDYWSWIEPLQDYYFNEKQNPLLRQVVGAIAASPKVRTTGALIGSGWGLGGERGEEIPSHEKLSPLHVIVLCGQS